MSLSQHPVGDQSATARLTRIRTSRRMDQPYRSIDCGSVTNIIMNAYVSVVVLIVHNNTVYIAKRNGQTANNSCLCV